MGTQSYHYSWIQLRTFIEKVYSSVKFEGVDLIYGIPRGGVTPAIMLSHFTGIPVIISQAPPPMTKSTKLLIVDDIYDTGATLKKCISECSVFTDNIITMCLIVRNTPKSDWRGFVDYHNRELTDERWAHFPWESVANIPINKAVC